MTVRMTMKLCTLLHLPFSILYKSFLVDPRYHLLHSSLMPKILPVHPVQYAGTVGSSPPILSRAPPLVSCCCYVGQHAARVRARRGGGILRPTFLRYVPSVPDTEVLVSHHRPYGTRHVIPVVASLLSCLWKWGQAANRLPRALQVTWFTEQLKTRSGLWFYTVQLAYVDESVNLGTLPWPAVDNYPVGSQSWPRTTIGPSDCSTGRRPPNWLDKQCPQLHNFVSFLLPLAQLHLRREAWRFLWL